MSNEQHKTDNSRKMTKTVVLLAFILPTIIIIALIALFGSHAGLPSSDNSKDDEAIAARIRPVANIELNANSGPRVAQTGEEIYKSLCISCHDAGVAGAPKFGESGAWAPRIAKGFDTILNSALNGLNGMPARGGNPDLSDFEVHRAVVYMLNNSGGNFPEPEEPKAEEGAEGEAVAGDSPAQAAPAAQ